MTGKCTVNGKDNMEDKTREEADMTLSPFFPKVIQKICYGQKQIWIWTTFEDFGKTGLGVMSASSLVLSSFLSFPSTVHLPAREVEKILIHNFGAETRDFRGQNDRGKA